MAVNLSLDVLKLYFLGQQRHRSYQDTVDLMTALKTHADGTVPANLINQRRPSESQETMDYRQKIYVPKTKNPVGKVVTSLSKIRRSPDWSIKYDKSKFPSSIVEGETLEDYCEKYYPGHTTVTNWVFSVLLKTKLIDANAVIAVFPLNWDAAQQNEYYKPQAMVFNSDQVLYFEEGAEYAILQSYERSSLTPYDPLKNIPAGSVHYVITTTEFSKWERDTEGNFQRTQYILHNKGKLPVFKNRGQFLKQKENSIIQESRISQMVPSLDEAAREYSDLQAAKVQHMYPLFWYYQSKACQSCNGAGKVATTAGAVTCSTCSGSGKIKFSPYVHLEVEPPKIGDQAVPAPPAGYITRDVEIIKHQEDSVKTHLYDALAAINMQFLDQTPLSISGDAKNVDREELNNFIYSIAEDLIADMDQTYWWINEWRYAVVVSDLGKREAMLPEITVPENFDLLPANYLVDEIGKGRTAGVNPILIATMEEDYAVKKFYNNPDIASMIACYYELDPLPGYEADEKMSLLQNKGITQEDYVISAYIMPFVKRAIAENQEFLTMSYDDKIEIIQRYAQEKMKEVSAAEQVKQNLLANQVAAANDPAQGTAGEGNSGVAGTGQQQGNNKPQPATAK